MESACLFPIVVCNERWSVESSSDIGEGPLSLEISWSLSWYGVYSRSFSWMRVERRGDGSSSISVDGGG